MNKKIAILSPLMATIIFSGCASDYANLSKKPVIPLESTKKGDIKNGVVLLKAGSKIPIYVKVSGDMFTDGEQRVRAMNMHLKRDLYLHGDVKKDLLLASFDKKNWQPLGILVTGYSGFTPYVDGRIQEAGIEFFLKADKR